MTVWNVVSICGLSLLLYGSWLGVRALKRLLSYRSSRFSAARFNMRETRLRVRMENCRGEFGLLDMSQSGMAIFIDHFVDDFSLTKHERFVLRNTHGDFPARLVTGKVIYLKQLAHGYRMGVQFDFPIESEIVDMFRHDVIQSDEASAQQAA